MKNILNWVNRNTNEDGTRVFRETAPFTSTDGLTALATLPQGANSYEDSAVVKGQLYYYRLEVFKGTDKYLGNQVAITALAYTGPGPQTLLRGDFERGWFGEVSPSLLFNGDELALRAGLASAGSVINVNTNWLKFAHKGKILFMPKLPIRYQVSWNQVLAAGCVYGNDSEVPNPLPSGAVITPQGKILEVNGDRFLVRLPKGAKTNPAVLVMVSNHIDVTNGGADGSEWNDCMLSICNTVPASQTWGNLDNIPDYDLVGGGQYHMSLCQEVAGTNNAAVVVRGAGYNAANNWPAAASVGFSGASSGPLNQSVGGISANRYTVWRPVLEFLP